MKKMPWLETGPYTVFDLETTGMSPVHNRIIEIGAVRLEKDGSVSRFQTLINPGMPIPVQITRITGITTAMVAEAPLFENAAPDFLSFIQGSRLIAHNGRFDLSFLMESLARINSPEQWQNGVYDSIPLARQAFPGLASYSLPFLTQMLGLGAFAEGTAHRALYDAELTMELFCRSMKILTGATE